jgi:F0F1-type ATP synthase delta subunit
MLAHRYAEALYQLTKDRPQDEAFAVYLRLKELLAVRGHARLLPAIVRHFERIVSRADHDRPTIVVASEHERTKHDAAITKALSDLSIDPTRVQTRIDPSSVGGFKVYTDNKQYDATYKRALISLYQQLAS